MSDKLLRSIFKIVGQDLVKQSKAKRHYGTQEFHIEEFKRLPDKDGAFQFEVTTWSEESEDPRETVILSFADLIKLIPRLFSLDCLSAVCAEVNKNPHERRIAMKDFKFSKEADALDQLRIVFVEAMLTHMKNDDELTQMEYYAKIGLEKEIESLTFEQLDSQMVELIRLNGDVEVENEED